MPLEILTGPDVPALLARAQQRLGAEAVVLSVRRLSEGGQAAFEMVAADARTAAQQRRESAAAAAHPAPTASYRPGGSSSSTTWADAPAAQRPGVAEPGARPSAFARETAQPYARVGRFGSAAPKPFVLRPAAAPPAPAAHRPAPRSRAARSRVIALVGPTGGGKTTTIAKLANHPAAFGGGKAGLLCLDIYRIGAVEQLRHYAELSRLPFEVAWDARDTARAMRRLRGRDVILVDTAGRGPRAAMDLRDTQKRLLEVLPDEVHLVLPAGLQRPLARRIVTAHLPLGVTHLLPTKLDEFPDERVAFELAAQFGLPVTWIADGQEVPRDLQRASAAPAASTPFALQDAA